MRSRRQHPTHCLSTPTPHGDEFPRRPCRLRRLCGPFGTNSVPIRPTRALGRDRDIAAGSRTSKLAGCSIGQSPSPAGLPVTLGQKPVGLTVVVSGPVRPRRDPRATSRVPGVGLRGNISRDSRASSTASGMGTLQRSWHQPLAVPSFCLHEKHTVLNSPAKRVSDVTSEKSDW